MLQVGRVLGVCNSSSKTVAHLGQIHSFYVSACLFMAVGFPRIPFLCGRLQHIRALSLVFRLSTRRPPACALALEKVALTKAAPGPHKWCIANDLGHLQTAFGLPLGFRSLSGLAVAAQSSCGHVGGICVRGPNIRERAAVLDRALMNTDFLGRRVCLAFCYKETHVSVLRRSLHR